MEDGVTQPEGQLLGHTEGVTHLSARGDGIHIISNGKDSTVRMWDLRKMAPGSLSVPRSEMVRIRIPQSNSACSPSQLQALVFSQCGTAFSCLPAAPGAPRSVAVVLGHLRSQAIVLCSQATVLLACSRTLSCPVCLHASGCTACQRR